MKEYYLLNKEKLIYAAKIYLLAFGFIAAICVSVIIYFYYVDTTLVISLGLLATVVLTAFLILQTLISGNYLFQRRKNLYRIPALRDFFNDNNFLLFKTETTARMEMSELLMKGNVNGFLAEADLDEENPLFLIFKFRIHKTIQNKIELQSFLQLLKNSNAYYSPEGIILKMEIGKLKSTEYIQKQLHDFTEILRNNDCITVYNLL